MVEEGALERLIARAAHGEDMTQLRQVGADLAHHGDMIEAAPQRRHDRDLGLGEAHHEAQLALPEDRHQRVGHGADAVAGIE